MSERECVWVCVLERESVCVKGDFKKLGPAKITDYNLDHMLQDSLTEGFKNSGIKPKQRL